MLAKVMWSTSSVSFLLFLVRWIVVVVDSKTSIENKRLPFELGWTRRSDVNQFTIASVSGLVTLFAAEYTKVASGM